MQFRKLRLTHRFLVLGLAAAAPAALVLGLFVPGAVQATVTPGSSSVTATPRSSSVTDFVTFYGWVDNSPPGPAIAHPCIHKHAGGTGTFSDPVTLPSTSTCTAR